MPDSREVMNVIGDVSGRDCILVDDIVDSGGTLCNAADALIRQGAAFRLGLRDTRRAVGRRGGAYRVVAGGDDDLTDSIMATEAVRLAHNIRQVTIAPLIAEAVRRIAEESSVSSLFD